MNGANTYWHDHTRYDGDRAVPMVVVTSRGHTTDTAAIAAAGVVYTTETAAESGWDALTLERTETVAYPATKHFSPIGEVRQHYRIGE